MQDHRFRVKLYPGLLDPMNIRNADGLETALSTMEGYFLNPAANQQLLLNDICNTSPTLLGFLLSEIDKSTAEYISNNILEAFPTTADSFEQSVACKLLVYFSHYFGALSFPSANLDECDRAVKLAQPLLKAIATLDHSHERPKGGRTDNKRGAGRSRQQTQREFKKSKRIANATIDPTPFDNVGVKIPQSSDEADALAQDVLKDQKYVLKYYLEVLRKPELRAVFKDAYIPQVIDDAKPMANSHLDGAVAKAPGAYPIVQPLKAALYFDGPAGFGAWSIWMSQRAIRHIRDAKRRDAKMFKIIVKKIKELSHGHFSDDNQKHIVGKGAEVPIFEAKMTDDTRLVYQIDCIRDFDSEIDKQVIRIFGVYTHSQFDHRLWDAVSRQRTACGKEYRNRCTYRNPAPHPDNVVLPATFPPQDGRLASTSDLIDLSEFKDETKEELHSLLVLEKFVSLSQALIESMLADDDVSHVFDLSPEEQDIVKHTSSCFVIGRSGTGKTTTMLFKMLGIEQAWDDNAEDFVGAMPHPRQVFVTESRVLAEKVQEYFYKLYNSRATANRSDPRLRGPAMERSADDMFDLDEEEFWRDDLPKCFSQLEDHHFPLFLTKSRFYRLLEAEAIEAGESKEVYAQFYAQFEDDSTAGAIYEMLPSEYMRQRHDHFVSYELFVESYWPHFPQHLTKGLDPSLAYAEIMGVIKGSEEALKSAQGCMEQEHYLSMSHRTQAMFSQQRNTIWELFESYTKLKRSRGDCDAADRTHAIVRYLRKLNGIPGQGVSSVYVDEVQDNLIIDSLILRLICRDPNGLFWAGDTAQTISAGSSFRFDDLKAFVHRIEVALQNDPQPPKAFQLTRNYRSHAGITNCAQTVVKLISHFWPYSIDILADERGVVDGVKPVFFTGWDQDVIHYEQFLFGTKDNQVEFGARQCILVRDEAALERLQHKIGKNIGVIMTLYDSKGLEYDDVLLYNFFEDSPCTISQWRVLLNFLPDSASTPCPSFEETSHNGLCRELKSLYVAVTRARKHLWIADSSQKAEIMKIIWDDRKQISHCTPDTDIPVLATSSSAEEWLDRGNKLFKSKNYLQAMHAYERAHDQRRKRIAEAYHLRVQAKKRTANRASLAEQIRFYTMAARAFWSIAEAAADSSTEKKVFYRISAECYLSAKEDVQAAAAYELAEEYSLSASRYRLGKKFDDAVRVVQTYGDQIDLEITENIIDVSKLYYLNVGRFQDAYDLFESDDQTLAFLDGFGYTTAQIQLLVQRHRYTEAAALHGQEGRFVPAVKLCMMEEPSPERERQACEYLLKAFWLASSLDSSPPPAKLSSELFEFATMLDRNALDEGQRDQLEMFENIRTLNKEQLRSLGKKFHGLQLHASFILCYHHLFRDLEDQSAPPYFENRPALMIASILSDFVLYAETMQKLEPEYPDQNEHLQKLWAFSEANNGLYFIPVGTLMFSRAEASLRLNVSDKGFEIARQDLRTLSSYLLAMRLRERVKALNVRNRSRSIEPCLRSPRSASCSPDCLAFHIEDSTAYNLRVIITLLKIRIYHTIWGIESHGRRRPTHSFLLSQLYECINPPSYTLGSSVNLDRSRISDRTLRIVLQWVGESFYALRIDPDSEEPHKYFITSILQLFFLFQWATDSARLPRYLFKVTWAISTNGPPWLMQSKDQTYIIPTVLDFIGMRNNRALSQSVMLLSHIFEKKVPIDVAVLCDLVDSTGSLLITAHRLQTKSSLREITLPRRWFQPAIKLGDLGLIRLKSQQMTSLLSEFARIVAQLLERLSSGLDAEHVLSRDFGFSTLTSHLIRNMYLGRICQALILFGLNIADEPARDVCLNAVHNLRQSERDISTYDRYATVLTWTEMAKVIGFRLPLSPLDALVTLCDNNNPPAVVIDGAKPTLIADLFPNLLSADHDTGRSTSNTPVSQIVNADRSGDEAKVTVDSTSSVSDTQSGLSRTTAPEQPFTNASEADLFSPEELSAGQKIWKAYQRYRRRHSLTGMTLLRSQVYMACLETCAKCPAPVTRSYRHIFLGPFPHLYTCLQSLHTYACEDERRTKKALRGIDHLKLEEARDNIRQASTFVQKVKNLFKDLYPSSAVHTNEDKARLRALAMNVVGLSDAVPKTVSHQWRADLRLATTGIITLPEVNKPKPTLNVEDLDPDI